MIVIENKIKTNYSIVDVFCQKENSSIFDRSLVMYQFYIKLFPMSDDKTFWLFLEYRYFQLVCV